MERTKFEIEQAKVPTTSSDYSKINSEEHASPDNGSKPIETMAWMKLFGFIR